ncbi:MAG: hypothetical protein RL377_1504 [Bacteroidota bacterium]
MVVKLSLMHASILFLLFLKKALGISGAKNFFARQTGIPITQSGLEGKASKELSVIK